MSYIDYDGEPDEESASTWTHSSFRSHWYNLYTKKHKAKPNWGTKETVLLTRMIKAYSADDLKGMMETAMEHASWLQFNAFYSAAPKWLQMYRDKEDDWTW
jgi:hypothetical protein